MGAVYQVLDPRLGARYALKAYLGSHMDESQLSRFSREVEALAATNHPNLVRIHSSGDEHGRPYFVMDLVEGQDLYHLLRGSPLPHRRAVEVVRDVARAVAALHARGIVHRDVKPGNVLVTGDGRALLTDLGVVRLMDDARTRLTVTGELVGTPAYMAPEQALGLPGVGPPADVWSLGMLLYALLAGRPPFPQGTSPIAVLQQVGLGKIAPLAESAPDVPRDLALLVAAALRRDPADRPTATAWAEALEDWLGGQSGRARAAVAAPRRGVFWKGALAGGLLAICVGGGWTIAERTRRQGTSGEPVLQRAERALEAGLAAFTVASPTSRSAARGEDLAPLCAELRQEAARVPEAEARALRGLLAGLLLLHAEEARLEGREAQAVELLGALPAEDQVELARLELLRDLRAAVAAGLPGGELDPDALTGAVQRWPAWRELALRRLRLALQAGRAWQVVGEASAFLDQTAEDAGAAQRRSGGPAHEARAVALEVLAAAEAWEPLAARVGPEEEPWASRVRAWRALQHLPRDPRAAALELEGARPLESEDPLRRALVTALQRVVEASPRSGAFGPGAAEQLRPELWAHAARWRLDPAYRIPPERTGPLWEFMFSIVGRPSFQDLEVGYALVPLCEQERLLTYYPTLMQGTMNLWFHLPPERQAWGLKLCREAWEWTRAQPPPCPCLNDVVDQLAIMLGRAGQVGELRALTDEAPALAGTPDAESELRCKLLRRLSHALQAKEPAAALQALDEAVALRPRQHELRAERAKLRELAEAGPDAVLEDLLAWLEHAPPEERGPGLLGWVIHTEKAASYELARGQPAEALKHVERALATCPGLARLDTLRLLLAFDACSDEQLAAGLDGLEARATQDEGNAGGLGGNFRDSFLRGARGAREHLPAAREALARGDREGVRQALHRAWAR